MLPYFGLLKFHDRFFQNKNLFPFRHFIQKYIMPRGLTQKIKYLLFRGLRDNLGRYLVYSPILQTESFEMIRQFCGFEY
jgi:hypothetical protein